MSPDFDPVLSFVGDRKNRRAARMGPAPRSNACGISCSTPGDVEDGDSEHLLDSLHTHHLRFRAAFLPIIAQHPGKLSP